LYTTSSWSPGSIPRFSINSGGIATRTEPPTLTAFRIFPPTGMVLRERGYLVAVPCVSGEDLEAFKIPLLLRELREEKIVPYGGFLVEISLHEVFGDVESQAQSTLETEEACSAAIEAESSPQRTRSYVKNQGFGQALKYLSSEFCSQAFVTGSLCFETHDRVGTISFREDSALFFNDAAHGLCEQGIFDRVKEDVRLLKK